MNTAAPPSLLTPTLRSGVEEIEHQRRRARYRGNVQLTGGATSGTIETEQVPQGFRWMIDYLSSFNANTLAAYVNTIAPDNFIGSFDGYHTGDYWLGAGDRLVIEVTAGANANVGVLIGYRLVEVELRAWPQAAPVDVVRLLGQIAPGPELVEPSETVDG